MSSAVPRLNLSSVGASTITTPNIPGMRFNGYVKSARGAGRICNFDMKYGFPTEGACETSRTARNNYNAVSSKSRFSYVSCTQTLTCTFSFVFLSFALSLFLSFALSLFHSFSFSFSIRAEGKKTFSKHKKMQTYVLRLHA